MKIKQLAIAMILGVSAVAAHATLLNFDTLPDGNAVSNGYGGLSWSNFSALNTVGFTTSGYTNGVVSPRNVIYNSYGIQASFSSVTPFSLNSMYLTAAWNDGLNVLVTGYLNNIQVATTTFILNTLSPTLEVLNWVNVDKVSFVSYGGSRNPAYTGSGTHFALDNLTINEQTNIPEPASLALFGLGLAGLAATRRRKS